MSHRRMLLVAVPVLVLVAVAGLALALRSGSGDERPAPARADEPLAYLRGGERVVVDVDTRAPLVGLLFAQLAPRLSGGAVRASDLALLLGGRAVFATGAGGAEIALVAPDRAGPASLARRLRPAGSYRGARLYSAPDAALAVRGATVVLAVSVQAVRAALDERASTVAADARATFDRRFAGLPTGAARVAFDPRALLSALSPGVARTRWGRSLRDGAAVLVAGSAGLRLPFHLTGDPVGLRPADLPIATGTRPPRPRGRAPLTVALRTAARGAGFASAAGVTPFDLLDGLPSFLRPDLDGLSGEATITSADLRRFTAVTDPPDPADWADRLERLDLAAGLLGRLGIGDLRIDASRGSYSVTRDGELVARAGLFGPTLALTNDPRAVLRAAAAARPGPPPPGAAGGLTARLAPAVVRDLARRGLGLPALVLARLGEATGWARAALTGVTGELRLAVR